MHVPMRFTPQTGWKTFSSPERAPLFTFPKTHTSSSPLLSFFCCFSPDVNFACSRISYQWDHAECSFFVSYLFAQCLAFIYFVACISILFLFYHQVVLHCMAKLYLSIYLLVGIWVISDVWLLWESF